MRRSLLLMVLAVAIVLPSGCASRPSIPDFDPDSVSDHYSGSTAALAWAGATRAFQVTPAGDLTNGVWRVRVRLSGCGVVAGAPRVIAFEQRWRPVAHWRVTSGSILWDLEAVAFPEAALAATGYGGTIPAPRDSGLVVSLRVRATHTGGDGDAAARAGTSATEPCDASLELTLEPADSTVAFVDFDGDASPPRWASSSGAGAPPAMGLAALEVEDATARARWRLRPGVTLETEVLLPAYPIPGAALVAAARTPHERRAEESRRFWDGEIARGARFELDDPETEHALAAAIVVLLTCRERRAEHWVPIGSPLHYRDVWLRDGARAIAALAMAGYTDESRALADGIAGFQWPPGAFLSQRGQLDGTGQALWAFEQALLRPAPDDSLRRFAAAATRAWRWAERQRVLGRETGWRFGEMLPFADPRDNERVRARLVGTDAWMIAGYRATSRLLRAAGETAAADSVEASLRRYRDDFAAALDRTGHADLPPSWEGIGRDWGNLAAVYPCGALPPRHPRAAALARRIWGAGGAGLATHALPESLHYYVGADLGTWALLAGEPAAAESVLAGLLLWRSASGGAGELFSRDGGYGGNLPVHATSAACLVTLARNCLIYDDADTLMLTLGARDSWWRGARVRRAPTRWGLVDLEFARRGDVAEWRWTPVSAWTTLTLPRGTEVARALAPPLVAGASPGEVLAPPGTRTARVRIAERRAR